MSNTITGALYTTGTYTSSYSGGDYNPLSFLEEKSINLEKLKEMSDERRTSILSLISSLASSNDSSVRKMLLNTLEVYDIFEDKEVLLRKIKIESVIS